MTPSRDVTSLTISEVALATGQARRVVQRQIRNGTFANAFREKGPGGSGQGVWRIPIDDLSAAGIVVDELVLDPAESNGAHGPSVRLSEELARLRAELSEERALRMVAEALAEERANALEHARLELVALSAAAGNDSATRQAAQRNLPPRPRGNWLR